MIGVELVKLVRKPRTWASILLLCALPTVVAVFIAVTHVAPSPGQGPALLSAVLSNGTLYPAAALALVLPIFLPIAVAIMAGDAIAGEATSGTLRPAAWSGSRSTRSTRSAPGPVRSRTRSSSERRSGWISVTRSPAVTSRVLSSAGSAPVTTS